MKTAFLIIFAICLSACSTVIKQPGAHHKKYTFQAIDVISKEGNTLDLDLDKLLKCNGVVVDEFPVVQLLPGEELCEEDIKPLRYGVSISTTENSVKISDSDERIAEIGNKFSVRLFKCQEGEGVKLKLSLQKKEFSGMSAAHKVNSKVSIAMPKFKEVSINTNLNVTEFNKWVPLGGLVKGESAHQLFVRVIPPSSESVESILKQQIIMH